MIRSFIRHMLFRQYPAYRFQIWKENQATLLLFLVLCCAVTLLNTVTNLLISRSVTFSSNFVLLAYFLCLLIVYIRRIRKNPRYMTLLFYLMEIPVLTLTALMGSVLDTNSQMFTFGIMLIALPMFILDRPVRVSVFIISFAVLFALIDFHAKDEALFLVDMRHLVMQAFVALILNNYILFTRIANIMKVSSSIDSAEHDQMTGLYNRGGGDSKIRSYLAGGIAGTFILLDVDDFKHVNDNYGHSTGDEVLKKVSQALVQSFRQNDVVMRMGGDEFIVYAPGLQDYNFVETKLKAVLLAMNRIVLSEDGTDFITVSMGCVVNDGSYPDYESVFEEADKLLYQVKENGKNSFRLQNIPFDPERIRRSGSTLRSYDKEEA